MSASPGRWLAFALALGAAVAAAAADEGDYLRYASFEVPINEHVLLRWPEKKMPLRVYLTAPPAGLFEDPEAVHDAVRRGIVDWTGVAGKGLPRFEFVDEIGKADIPVVWNREPDGHWFIAHCAYDIQPLARRFGVSRILVTGRWRDRQASASEVYRVVLHEVGHALGIGGHSPQPGDIMFESLSGGAEGLSERDRATLKKLYARPIGSRVTGARGVRSQ